MKLFVKKPSDLKGNFLFKKQIKSAIRKELFKNNLSTLNTIHLKNIQRNLSLKVRNCFIRLMDNKFNSSTFFNFCTGKCFLVFFVFLSMLTKISLFILCTLYYIFENACFHYLRPKIHIRQFLILGTCSLLHPAKQINFCLLKHILNR